MYCTRIIGELHVDVYTISVPIGTTVDPKLIGLLDDVQSVDSYTTASLVKWQVDCVLDDKSE